MSKTKLHQCCEEVFQGFHEYPCSHPGKVERDGKWYCGVHDPEKMKAREKVTNLKWRVDEAASKVDRLYCRCRHGVPQSIF